MFCLVGTIPAAAQQRFSDNLYLSAASHYGFIVPEYSSLLYLVERPIHSLGVNLSKKTRGENDWERLYNYPEYGLSLFYSTLGNDDVHGREIAAFPYFRIDIRAGKRMDLYNETGLGLAYVTRRFDLQDNYLNVAVGSNLNIHFGTRLGFEYKTKGKLRLNAGAAFDHFSNSNTTEPNLGLNYATLFAGARYRLGDETPRMEGVLPPLERDMYFEFLYSGGLKHPRAIGSKTYFTSSATFEVKWKAFRVLRLGVGADLFYDGSTEAEMRTLEMKHHKSLYDFRSGIHFSQEVVYNRFSLIVQEGFYIGLIDQVEKHVMYNRGIIRYRLGDHLLVQLAMKSHLYILDYPEVGVGLTW